MGGQDRKWKVGIPQINYLVYYSSKCIYFPPLPVLTPYVYSLISATAPLDTSQKVTVIEQLTLTLNLDETLHNSCSVQI